MKAFAALLLPFLAMYCPGNEYRIESTSSSPAIAQRVSTELAPILEKHDFQGALQISGGRLDGAKFEVGYLWPWASVTKQVVAVMVMQEVEAGKLALDVPVSTYLNDWPMGGREAPTLRQLLQHQSGLYDPEDDAGFVWDTAAPIDPMMCVAQRQTAPGGAFNYNNCDFLLVGRILEASTGTDMPTLFETRFRKPLKMKKARFAYSRILLGPTTGRPGAEGIEHYGAAGGLVGTPEDLLKFDRALMSGKLLSEQSRAEMWRGDPDLGYTALGQWDATLPLAGCSEPVRIIERRGAIDGYQARNFILPDLGIAIVAFVGRSEGQYDFGEPWSQSGLSYELLSAAACGA